MTRLLRAAALAAALATAALAAPIAFAPSVTVSVGASATALAVSTRHTFIEACNVSTTATVYRSFSSTVTTATGQPLPPGTCVQFQRLAQGQLLYGVVSSGTADVRISEGFEQ